MTCITADDLAAFNELRMVIMNGVRRALEIDGHCKSYEGRMSIMAPSYFDERDTEHERPEWSVRLSCYVLGPRRGYDWTGSSLAEACKKALADVRKWVEEIEERQ